MWDGWIGGSLDSGLVYEWVGWNWCGRPGNVAVLRSRELEKCPWDGLSRRKAREGAGIRHRRTKGDDECPRQEIKAC